MKIITLALFLTLFPWSSLAQQDASAPEDVIAPVAAEAAWKVTVPETPTEVGQTVTTLAEEAKQGHWAPVVGLVILLLIWFFRKFDFLSKLPKQALPWISLAIGVLGYVGVALGTGLDWLSALTNGFIAGLGAVGLWELAFKHVLKAPQDPVP